MHLVVPATLPDARAATEHVLSLCGRFDVGDRANYGTAVMEWLVNVVKHSYVDAQGGSITIRATASAEGIELIVEDSGRGMPEGKFEAAAAEVIFDANDLACVPESGMGLAIIKSVMDNVTYRCYQGVNRLTATRRWQR